MIETLERRVVAAEVRSAAGGLIELSFSSDQVVEVNGVPEVLDHNAEAVDLDRLNAGAPLLFEHETERVVGVIERAWLASHRGRARIRFGTSALAHEVAGDVAAGIRRNVSVGYRVLRAVVSGGIRRVTRWVPYEVSVVAMPADISVGFGRSARAADEAIRAANDHDADLARFYRMLSRRFP